MKNREIQSLYQGLQQCGSLTGIKLSYAIARNLKKLSTEMETIQEEVKKLQLEYAKMDKDGKPLVKDNQYQMKDPVKFEEKYQELMNIETPIELFKVKESDISESVNAQQMTYLIEMIDEVAK